jgi:hypothetical protein
MHHRDAAELLVRSARCVAFAEAVGQGQRQIPTLLFSGSMSIHRQMLSASAGSLSKR